MIIFNIFLKLNILLFIIITYLVAQVNTEAMRSVKQNNRYCKIKLLN